MILLNIILFTLSGGILFYVVKYRVHVHVSYRRTNEEIRSNRPCKPSAFRSMERVAKTENRHARPTADVGRKRTAGNTGNLALGSPKDCRIASLDCFGSPPPTNPNTAALLMDTLVSLGASKQQAKKAANRAISLNPSTPFEGLLRAAIQETTAA